MSEIGIKDQCFGVEVEMTGITRRQAADALAAYFETTPEYLGTYYDTWGVTDPEGKVWKLMSDSSINPEQKTAAGYESLSRYDRTVNICVLNGSPRGVYSTTLHTVLYLQKRYPRHNFEIIHVGSKIRALEQEMTPALETMAHADLILFAYPVYTFIAPSQLHRFIAALKASGVDLGGKFATQITTSKHFYDVTAHRYIEDNCHDMGMKVIHGLSADMEDLTTKQGRKDAEAFFGKL